MSRRAEAADVTPSLSPYEAGQILEELERVLQSHQFRSSRRCQKLLRFITEQTVGGSTAALKERTLGIEVFQRSEQYDTSQDPVVRSTAAEIRKKLAQYYQEEGHRAELRIDLHPGSYVAEFHPGTAAPGPMLVAPSAQLSYRPLWPLGIASVLIFSIGAILLLRWGQTSELERLWAPVLAVPGNVLICVGQPVALNFKSAERQDAVQITEHAASSTPADMNGEPIAKRDLVVLPDRYLAIGDVICLLRLTSFLDRHHKTYRMRGEGSTSYADLNENPSILIAAFDNQWTLQAAERLRYTFVKDSARATDMVRDRQHPENTKWKVAEAWPNWDISEDYAIVSLVRDLNPGRPLLIAAGITQYGTTAAGEFVTDADAISAAVRGLQRDWDEKNIQFVLRVPVVQHTPGRAQVIATHVW